MDRAPPWPSCSSADSSRPAAERKVGASAARWAPPAGVKAAAGSEGSQKRSRPANSARDLWRLNAPPQHPRSQ
jgi:hypothetical protein